MGAACIDRKILQRHLECAVQTTRTFGGKHRKDITQDVMGAHRDLARGDLHTLEELSRVSEQTLEQRRPDRGPDESFGDAGIAGVEGMEVRVGFPLLEQQLYLPAQPIGLSDLCNAIALARQIGHEVAVLLFLRVPARQYPSPKGALTAALLDIEVEHLALGLVDVLQRFAHHTTHRRPIFVVAREHRRVDRDKTAHHEVGVVFLKLFQLLDVKVAAVGQHEAPSQLFGAG